MSHTSQQERGPVVCVFPHSDDLSIFAGGLAVALARTGRDCYLVRVTDDSKDSWCLPAGETAARLEVETTAAVAALGFAGEFRLGYANHYLDELQVTSLRHRLITLYRYLRAEIVVTFDPWAMYEENPDHRITGMAADQACWMSQRAADLPEHQEIGLDPCRIRTRVYVGRGIQDRNYHFDGRTTLGAKRAAILCHKTPLNTMVLEARQGYPLRANSPRSEEAAVSESLRRDYVESNLLPSRCTECASDLYCEPFHVLGDREVLPHA